MSTAPRIDIDVPTFWNDPYRTLAKLRKEASIAHVPQLGSTLLCSRDDIFISEKQIDVFSSEQPDGLMTKLMGLNLMRRDGEARTLRESGHAARAGSTLQAPHHQSWRRPNAPARSVILDCLVAAADRALYAATEDGRDRLIMSGQVVAWPRTKRAQTGVVGAWLNWQNGPAAGRPSSCGGHRPIEAPRTAAPRITPDWLDILLQNACLPTLA